MEKILDIITAKMQAAFQEAGYEVHPYRTLYPGDIDQHIATMDPNYDIIIASGGDGTVNIVINAMMRRGLRIPLGIIPSGTANDFATYLGFKTGDVEDVCRTIVSTEPVPIDLGLVNEDIFFINVIQVFYGISFIVKYNYHIPGYFFLWITNCEVSISFFKITIICY